MNHRSLTVVAFNGSPRPEGNTAALLRIVLEELERESIKTDLVQLAGKVISGCIDCGKCRLNKDRRCALADDGVNGYIAKMAEAQGVLLGSPTYIADMSASLKALLERATIVSRNNGELFRRKPGAAVVAVRRAGSTHVLSSINYFFLINQMIVPGSTYWNLGIGREPGEVLNDSEGVETMRTLGRNMAWLMKRLAAGG